ncbi:MAG: SEC59/DGK1/VTE5 family protein [Nanoarchaeota archaeon]|nr:SEC59/DGK1/VTE5 family protein [Nanoarchaeota archaeon]
MKKPVKKTEYPFFELRRQAFHICLGLAIILLSKYQILSARGLFIILIVGILLSMVSSRYKLPGIKWFLKNFERRDIPYPGQGAIYFVLGSFAVLGLFPQNIAYAAIMILALGDSLATIAGKYFGKHKMGDKTVEGTIVGVIAGFIGAVFFVSASAAFLGSFVAMLAEALEIRLFGKVINDNILVPIVSAFIMYGVSLL